jgi:SAM-dependent methyltransferase
VARRAIERRGFSAKVDVVAGDMLASEFPGGCDAHLFSNVLHDWDVPVVKELLAKSQRALAKNGLLVIHDMHLNDTKTGPLPVAKYSALLMHATEGRCYGVAELRTWLGELGFAEVQFTPTGADRSIVTARKR